MLALLAGVPGVVRLVHSNAAKPDALGQFGSSTTAQQQPATSANEQPFLVTAPFGRCLELDDSAELILGAIACAAKVIGRLAQFDPPVLHRDVSLGNLMIMPETLRQALKQGKADGAYLLDFATARHAPGGQYRSSSSHGVTGTPLFMACSILDNKAHTVSSDLESLLLVLIYLACKGHVHWANCRLLSREALALKAYALSVDSAFHQHIEDRCLPGLLPAVTRLRKLFFVPDYKVDVTVEQFLAALSGA